MDAVEDIKSRLSIEDVISRYVELKRAGRNFRGLSPFSNEKTPSFMVSPEKQIWHDFSSGKGGNMFSFVMEMEGLDFKGALELLARQAGVDLSQYRTEQSGARGKQKERVYEANEAAAHFYQVQFSKNKMALEYILKTRKFSKQTALMFRIGYSPNGGAALATFLRGKGFSEGEMKQAGLVTQNYRGLGDMFRGRIMIPLQDQFGKVVGFTARLLEDVPGAPKYINTPQTIVYDKSRNIFGLYLAKEAIRKNKYAVVVEGNLDVIASHQAGVTQTVATAGTAMTEQQLKILGRFTHDVRLAFDQDNAGIQATERSIPLAARAGVSLSVITIPEGKDPDELIQKNPSAWEKVITKPEYALDWLVSQYQKRLDIKSAKGKREFSDVVLKVVRNLDDSVEQDHYITRIAELIGVSKDALLTKLNQGIEKDKQPHKRTAVQPAVLDMAEVERVKTGNHFLALALMRPDIRGLLQPITEDMLTITAAGKLLVFLQKYPDFNLKTDTKTIPSNTSDYVKILVLLYEELYQDLETLELHYEATRLQVRLIQNYVKTKKAKLAADMRSADEKQMEGLLKQAQTLDQLLKTTQKQAV